MSPRWWGMENAQRLHKARREVKEIREERISRRNRCQMLQRSRSLAEIRTLASSDEEALVPLIRAVSVGAGAGAGWGLGSSLPIGSLGWLEEMSSEGALVDSHPLALTLWLQKWPRSAKSSLVTPSPTGAPQPASFPRHQKSFPLTQSAHMRGSLSKAVYTGI